MRREADLERDQQEDNLKKEIDTMKTGLKYKTFKTQKITHFKKLC